MEIDFFEIAKNITEGYNEGLKRAREMDDDMELHRGRFSKELKETIEMFLMKHLGKGYNSDLFYDLYGKIADMLKKYQAEPSLF